MPVADWKTFKIYGKIWLWKKKIIRISYKKSHHFPASCVLCKFLTFIEKKKYICLIPNALSRKSPHGLQYVETHTTKRSPSSLWNNTVYTTRYLHCICEVKLKILMETHELLCRLPVWRNKLCGPCFLLCCACFFPFFQLICMTVEVHDLCCFDLYRQNNQLIVNFILCQGNLNFCSEKFLEPWYNLSSETEVMLWKPEMWIHISVETKFFS